MKELKVWTKELGVCVNQRVWLQITMKEVRQNASASESDVTSRWRAALCKRRSVRVMWPMSLASVASWTSWQRTVPKRRSSSRCDRTRALCLRRPKRQTFLQPLFTVASRFVIPPPSEASDSPNIDSHLLPPCVCTFQPTPWWEASPHSTWPTEQSMTE